jgi:hypothetical protein
VSAEIDAQHRGSSPRQSTSAVGRASARCQQPARDYFDSHDGDAVSSRLSCGGFSGSRRAVPTDSGSARVPRAAAELKRAIEEPPAPIDSVQRRAAYSPPRARRSTRLVPSATSTAVPQLELPQP